MASNASGVNENNMERVRLSRSSQAWRQLSARPAKAPGVPALGGSATPVSSGTDTHVCAPTNSRMARMSTHAEGNRPPSPCLRASLRPCSLFYSTTNPNRNARNSVKTQGRSTSYSTTTPGSPNPLLAHIIPQPACRAVRRVGPKQNHPAHVVQAWGLSPAKNAPLRDTPLCRG